MGKTTLFGDQTTRVGGVTVSVRGAELEVNTDAGELGAGPAAAIAKVIGEQLAGSTVESSKATIAARRREGRSGTHAMNDTGTLARGIAAQAVGGGTFEITAPSGRLDPAAFRTPEAYQHALELLHEAAPATVDPLAPPAVTAAIGSALDKAIK